MKSVSLPPVFAQYEGKVQYVQQHSPTEWSSECPACGGVVHQDGSWPDRCRWFTRGTVVAWCRRCSKLFFPDGNPPSVDEIAKWHQKQIEYEEERRRSAERALANLRNTKLWQQYHDQMDAKGRLYWRKAGIPDEFQDIWQLGWNPAFSFFHNQERYERESATIPLFGPQWNILNIKHRIINPPDEHDKYRPEISGWPQPLFRCSPEKEIEGEITVVEGEKKAMVLCVTLDSGNANIVGLPGITPPKECITEIAKAERVTLITDPGSRAQTWSLVKKIGREKCRVFIPHEKLDDWIIRDRMDARTLRSLIRQNAVPTGVA